MTVQERALALLRADEGVRRYAYDDATGKRVEAPVGKLTIGCGINLDEGLPDELIDLTERYYLHCNTLELRTALAQRGIVVGDLPEDARLALSLMAFQLGAPRVLGFHKMLHFIRAGNWRMAATEALESKWARQTLHRAREVADLFRGCVT